MPRFEVELEDGRKFEFEADSQPSESEIMDAIGTRDKAVNAPQYEPEGMPEKDTRSVSVSSPIGVPWNVELPIDPSQSVAPIPRAEPKTQTGKVTLSSPIGVPMELDKDTMTKAGAAVLNTAASVPNFMLSPVGTATMPIGGTALGKAAIQGVFAGLSAKGGAEALGEASVTGDTQKAMEGALMLGLAPTMATPSIHPKVAGALTPKPKPQWQGPIATGEILKRSAAVLPESTKAVIETLGPEEAAKISEAMTQRATAALENVEQAEPTKLHNSVDATVEAGNIEAVQPTWSLRDTDKPHRKLIVSSSGAELGMVMQTPQGNWRFAGDMGAKERFKTPEEAAQSLISKDFPNLTKKPAEVSNAIETRIEPKSGVTKYQQAGEGRVSTTPSGGNRPEPEATVPNAAQGQERVLLTEKQMLTAARKIRKHYGLNRAVTRDEVLAEVANLRRKEDKGSLDDRDQALYSALSVGKDPIDIKAAPTTEIITPSEDTVIGKNAAGETLYERANGNVYRMRFDRKTKPNGYPDFGGDLAPVEQPAPTQPTPETAKAKEPWKGKIQYETFDEPRGEWQPETKDVVVSKSTIPGDKPWRATVFSGSGDSLVAIGHVQLDSPSLTPEALSALSEQLGRYTRKIRVEKQIEKSAKSTPTQPAAAKVEQQVQRVANKAKTYEVDFESPSGGRATVRVTTKKYSDLSPEMKAMVDREYQTTLEHNEKEFRTWENIKGGKSRVTHWERVNEDGTRSEHISIDSPEQEFKSWASREDLYDKKLNPAGEELRQKINADKEAQAKSEADAAEAKRQQDKKDEEAWQQYQAEVEKTQIPKGRRGTIEVTAKDGSKIALKGTAYGEDFFISKRESKYDEMPYKVTHIRSGLGISGDGFSTLAEAVKYVKALYHAKVNTKFVEQHQITKEDVLKYRDTLMAFKERKAPSKAESPPPVTGETPQQAALPSTASEGSAKPGVSAPAPSAISNAKPVEQKTQAQEIVGMGGAVPGEFKPGQPMTSAIKNAAVDRDRVERGEKPMMDALRKHDSELWSQAMNVIDADWQAADKLIARYRAKPFIPTDVETMVLLHRRVDLKNEYAKADRQYVEAAKEGLPTAEGYKATRDGVLAQLHELEAMLGKGDTAAGTMAGRAFRARQLVMNEDYSLASLVADREITLGRKLTDAEAAELRKIADEYKAANDTLTKKLEEREKVITQLEEKRIAEQAARDAEKANAPSGYVLKIAEDIVSSWDKRADAARARLKERMSRMSAGVDPTIIVDLAEIGLSHVGHVGLDFAKWSTRMIKDVGEWAKPHLEEAWKKTNEIANADIIARRGKAEASEVKRAISRPAIALDAVKSVTTNLAKKVAKNKGYDLAWYARKLARHFWQQGIHEPQKLVDAVHGVLDKVIPELERRETMDALSGYGRYTQLTKDAVSVGLRDAYGQLQQIGKLEDMATGKAPLKSGFERRLPTDAERQLIKQVEEAKRKGGYDVTDPETQLRTAMQAAERRLTNQIADLEKEIKTRELIVKDKRKLVYDDKLNALKARRDALREQHDEIFKPGPMTEAERLALWKERTLERIEDYKERIAAGDVMPRKRPEPVKMDREALQIRYDLHKIHRALMDLRLKDQLKQRNSSQKAIDAVSNTLNFSRALLTGGEFSAVLRQGAPIVASHPIIGTKALGPMFKALMSEKNQFKINEELQLRDNAQLYERAGLEFTEMGTRLSTMEEHYMFRVSENLRKVWGVKHSVKFLEAFQRAFTTYLNVLRADTFDALVNAYGNDIGTAKTIANFINVANGRGSKWAAQKFSGQAWNTIFFAPRYTVSRFQYLAGQPLWMASKGNRAMILKEYGRALAGAAVVYTIGKMAGGTIETDPRSPDFGKIKLGDTRVDPLAGLSQATRFLATSATGWRKNVKGQLLPIRDSNRFMPSTEWQKVQYGQKTGAGVIGDFARSKLSPAAGAAVSFVTGKDLAQKPFKLSDTLINMAYPITYGDVLQAIEANGVEKGLALGTLAVFGMGVQTYTPTRGVPR